MKPNRRDRRYDRGKQIDGRKHSHGRDGDRRLVVWVADCAEPNRKKLLDVAIEAQKLCMANPHDGRLASLREALSALLVA